MSDTTTYERPEPTYPNKNGPQVAEDFERRVLKAMHRTPEGISEARRQMEPYFIPPRPLPPGKILEAVFVGAVKESARKFRRREGEERTI